MESNIVEQGQQYLDAIFEKHPEFKIIDDKIDELRRYGFEYPNVISDHLVLVDSYLSRIAEIVPKYVAHVNNAYLHRKNKYFSSIRERINEGEGITKAKESADESVLESKLEEATWQYVADTLKGKEKAYDRHISVCQSRLKFLTNEYNRPKNG